MRFNVFKNTVLLFVLVLISCGSNSKTKDTNNSNEAMLGQVAYDIQEPIEKTLIIGANQTEAYLPLLNGKRVGIVANQTSVVFKGISKKAKSTSYTHLVDSLVALQVNVKKVFAPEHGFRGTADAGEVVKDGIDTKTGLPIVSLYGKNKKPSAEQLKDLDVVIFDIQDVGARFYTYISSLHYVMEACAEANIPVLILDRPNPNGHYIDGPILEMEHKSFVGMHPVPVVHGMTIGEYAQMINGEKWLENGVQCKIAVIAMENYTHDTVYNLPINPSPNLPNAKSINLYPSLCFFEGTNVSAGRGTDKQFQIFGSPFLDTKMFPYTYEFTPKPNAGSKYPKHENKQCYGMDLSTSKYLSRLDLNYIIEAYQATANKETFFNNFFTKLAGTKELQKQIETRHTAYEIKKTWVRGLASYDTMRQAYLLYK
ncbi:exo-beta-N-acetylmuramidase NamZ family protein [Lacinutrix sp. MEBiC02404]